MAPRRMPTPEDVEAVILGEGQFVEAVLFDGNAVLPVIVEDDRVWPADPDEFWDADEVAARFPLGHVPDEADFVAALGIAEGTEAWAAFQQDGPFAL